MITLARQVQLKLKKIGVHISDDLCRSELNDLMEHYNIKMRKR